MCYFWAEDVRAVTHSDHFLSLYHAPHNVPDRGCFSSPDLRAKGRWNGQLPCTFSGVRNKPVLKSRQGIAPTAWPTLNSLIQWFTIKSRNAERQSSLESNNKPVELLSRRALKALTETFQKGNQIGKMKDKVGDLANGSLSGGQVIERGRMVLREDSRPQSLVPTDGR